MFLDSCGGVDEGARVAKIFYQIKKNSPEHFFNRDPESPKIQQCLKAQDYFYLPNTPKGDLVVFHRLSSSKSSDYVFDEAIKTFFMTIGECHRNFRWLCVTSIAFLLQIRACNIKVHATVLSSCSTWRASDSCIWPASTWDPSRSSSRTFRKVCRENFAPFTCLTLSTSSTRFWPWSSRSCAPKSSITWE